MLHDFEQLKIFLVAAGAASVSINNSRAYRARNVVRLLLRVRQINIILSRLQLSIMQGCGVHIEFSRLRI
jgi:hypothetical protein